MIEIKDLSFSYGRKDLFQEMDLTLQSGNIYGLLGLNGAGKSTLLKLMTGLLFPTEGTLTTLGYDPAKRDPGLLSKLFVLPEELNTPGMTDREYVRVRAPFYPGFDHDRLDRYRQEFDLPRERKLTTLSYGQKKKFLLSFGLACNASLVLLDEPTNGLDIPSKGLFRRLIAEALTDEQIFIISTHQVRDVEALIDPIVILHEGTVLFNQTLAQVTSHIRISHSTTRPDSHAEGLLYCEPTVGGFSAVWKDENATDGQVDLEVLFKSVITSPETISSLFEAGRVEA
jgi:ABC-2 type transport system ATP-binding protein